MKFVRPGLITRSRAATAVSLALVAIGAGVVVPQAAHAADPKVNVNSPTVIEGTTGTSPVTVTFTLSENNASPVSVKYSTVDGTATAGVDYVAQTGEVVFPANTTSKTVVFSVKGDLIDEADETFTVKLGAITGGTAGTNGVVTITDDDQPPSVVIDDAAKAEGNSGTSDLAFTIRLSSPSGQPTKVHVATQARRDPSIPTDPTPPKATAGSDYTAVNTDVTIPANTLTAQVKVPIKGDTVNEFDEQFEVQLSAATNGNVQTPTDFAVGTINNDDPLPRIDVSDSSANEGAANCGQLSNPACNEITFTLTLSSPSDKTVSVDYATEDRSATASGSGADYTASSGSRSATPSSTALTFAPGITQITKTITLRGDNTAEPNERFALNLTNPNNAVLGDAQAFGLIVNDDGGSFPTVSVSNATDATEAADAKSTFTFTASWPLGNTSTITVLYTTADGPEVGTGAKADENSDYIKTTGTVQIPWSPAGTNTATVMVPLKNDAINEPDEFFQLQITDAGNANVTDAIGEAKIKDDDPLPKVSIAATATKAEGTGANVAAQIPVTLSAASGQPVTVDYSTPQPNSGTATVGDDYTNTSGSVTFEPGQTAKTIDVTVVADAIDEADETVNVVLGTVTGATIDKGSSVLTITDDDAAPTISIGNATVTEGDSGTTNATFAVTLSGASGRSITVAVDTADGTAKQPGDYASKTQTLTFAPGTTTQDFVVAVAPDTLDEADETFTATLSAPTNATVAPSGGTATGTILDDDAGPTVTVDNASAPEGSGKATFTLSLSPASSGRDVIVTVNTANGTATTGTDYTALTNKQVTIPAGASSATVDVPVLQDALDEPDETFTLNITNVTNGTASTTNGSGTGTIVDDDPAGGGPPTTTPPGTPGVKITTAAGPGGGPHVRNFNPNGSSDGQGFFDGEETTGKRVARGDLDGDGIDEIITAGGQNSSGFVSVYSAAGSLLVSTLPYGNNFRGGVFVAAGDINGDGFDEVITAAGAGGGPHVRTFSFSKTGNSPATLIGSSGFYAFDQTFGGGVTVGAGDLNGDGTDEILTGMASQGSQLRFRNYSGTGSSVGFGSVLFPYSPEFTGGVFPAAGDLTGDGKAEIVTATGPGGGGDPHLRTFNANGEPRSNGVYAYNVGFRGGFSVAVADLDGDGNGEIITGAGPTGGPHVKVFNATLQQQGPGFFAYGASFNGGVWVSSGIS